MLSPSWYRKGRHTFTRGISVLLTGRLGEARELFICPLFLNCLMHKIMASCSVRWKPHFAASNRGLKNSGRNTQESFYFFHLKKDLNEAISTDAVSPGSFDIQPHLYCSILAHESCPQKSLHGPDSFSHHILCFRPKERTGKGGMPLLT